MLNKFSTIFIYSLFMSQSIFALQFVEYSRFELPQGVQIEDVSLNDVDNDGYLELLYIKMDSVFIHYTVDDSKRFIVQLDESYDHAVLLADINKDTIPEIVTATYTDSLAYEHKIVSVEVYDGASDYQESTVTEILNTESRAYGAMGHSLDFRYGITELDAKDVTGDGYKDLIVSFGHYYNSVGIYADYSSGSNGAIIIFDDFPNDTIIYNGFGPYQDIQTLIAPDNTRYVAFQRPSKRTSSGTHLVPNYNKTSLSAGLFDLSSTQMFLRQESSDCPHDPYGETYLIYNSSNNILCAGNLDTSDEALEIITQNAWKYSCYYGDVYTIDGQYFLYKCYGVDSCTRTEYPLEIDLGIESEQYPGTYFAFLEDQFVHIHFDTGEILNSTAVTPSGALKWITIKDLTLLLTQSNQDVILYSLDELLSADNPIQQPAIFSMGRPYPNPFNASQTILITIDRPGSELNVIVYNLLGQEVDRIYQGTPNSTQLEISWHADNFASGVYFIKTFSGTISQVVKTVLLK